MSRVSRKVKAAWTACADRIRSVAFIVDAHHPGGSAIRATMPEAGGNISFSTPPVVSSGRHFSCDVHAAARLPRLRSEEHTSELQSLMRISYAVFCLKKKKNSNYNRIQAQKI